MWDRHSNGSPLQRFNASTLQRVSHPQFLRGFTMMEIAISLAIIGIALVAIIGVLPYGISVQQDNRQETIIDQDSSVFMEAIRNGSVGGYDLTNYVYAITNYWAEFTPGSSGSTTNAIGVNGYTYSLWSIVSSPANSYSTQNGGCLTNNANIVGLMSTPEFTDANGNPVPWTYNANNYVYSNHVVAYISSVSGPAMEKPPQDNSIVRQDAFGYRIFCVNATVPANTNEVIAGTGPTPYEQEMAASLGELRLSFEWPQLPNGHLGSGRQTFQTLVAGRLQQQPIYIAPTAFIAGSPVYYNTNFYYYQPQWFTNAL
jgi:prepilin-type N-terminal cleavage/methylation domain-containing protein